jgi:hypothetical protein
MQWCKVLKKNYFKVLLKYIFGVSVLYYLYFWQLLLRYIPKKNHVLFTPYILTGTQNYSLHFECLAGQEKGPVHTLIETTHGHPFCLWSGGLTEYKCIFFKWCMSVGVRPWLLLHFKNKKMVPPALLNRRNFKWFILLLWYLSIF